MRDVITFLTSKEIIVVYIVAAIACFLAFIIYLVDKNYDKRKQKHNTKELNKLVEDVNNAINEEEKLKEEKEVNIPTPSVTPAVAPSVMEKSAPVELLEATNKEVVTDNVVLESLNSLETKEEPIIVKEEITNPSVTDVPKETEELEYTTIEPNVEQAKEQLRKLAMELEQEEKNKDQEPTIISNYEEEQETNAIISLEELVKKSKEMYAANELSQYKDEGNEPISLADLEKTKKTNITPLYDEPFIISNVVIDMENELNKENTKQLEIADFEDNKISPQVEAVSSTTPSNDLNNVKKDLYQTSKFKKSPVISPIYGIERNEDDYLQLENTANFDKLDEEIRKTNEFLMTLKELQKNLD